jgi:hypothetical protein
MAYVRSWRIGILNATLYFMKKILVRTLVTATAAAFLSTTYVLADDVQAPATPGTPAAQDSKTQLNNPPGQDAQATLHPKEGTKKKKMANGAKMCPTNHSNATASTDSGAGAKATKTPQVSMPPSAPNNQ